MATTECSSPSTYARAAAEQRTRGRSLIDRIATYWSTYRERRQLKELTPELLADIGLTPEIAYREANRPIWQLSKRHLH